MIYIYVFSGVQRQLTYDMTHYDDPSSVQGLLEYALKKLQPINIPKLHISSRLEKMLNQFNIFYTFLKICYICIFLIIYIN